MSHGSHTSFCGLRRGYDAFLLRTAVMSYRKGYTAFLLRAAMFGRIALTGGKGDPKKSRTKKLSYLCSF
jgi:hypothetical protein